MTEQSPRATYRLQLNSHFRFEDAIAALDYLRDLGISHIYLSPILTSRRGSGHGYDVTDATKIDPDLGAESGFAALQAAVAERGLGLLLDVVPNHMAASSENRWWMDVLEHGPDSPFAAYFDINWHPPTASLENKLLLPFLEKPFGELLDSGQLCLTREEGKFFLRYGEQVFPIAPSSYATILRQRKITDFLDPHSNEVGEWEGILAGADEVASNPMPAAQGAAERRTKFERIRDRLRELSGASSAVAAFLDQILETINGKPGDARSFCHLEQILARQHYRLAFWQTVSDAINYRRFFSITDLVGVRVEDPAVFDATHEALIRATSKGLSVGFRIDHIDGLFDPFAYLVRLKERLASENFDGGNPYIIVEKILARGELIPRDWPVQGTTGYEYLNYANRLLVDEQGARKLLEVYAKWTKSSSEFADILYQKKKLVMRTLLAVEMRALGRRLTELSRDDRYARELSPADLSEALVEVTACLPLYRTYIRGFDEPEDAQQVMTEAIEDARSRRSTIPGAYYDFIADVLLLRAPVHVSPAQREARLAFVSRWQQFTGPIVAKGLEDTALYVYYPLSSLNEVGGDPRLTNIDPLAFHEFVVQRQKNWPGSLNATTTHDTKRAEDVRARIAVLSEIPEEWETKLQEWSRANNPYTSVVNGVTVPDPSEEYLFYQTLVGAWPLEEADFENFTQRIQEYFTKATREAMLRTRWTQPNEAHESALRSFIAGVLDRESNASFFQQFQKFEDRIGPYGMLNGLGQALLKITSPGVPDFYQGSDIWDLRLVDPDNRGVVDFGKHARLFDKMRAAGCDCIKKAKELLSAWHDGRVKLHVIAKALRARRNDPGLFLEGDYYPLHVSGANTDRVFAFARQRENRWAIAAIPRCLAQQRLELSGETQERFWSSTVVNLPPGCPVEWKNVLAGNDSAQISTTDKGLRLDEVFKEFPLALLLPAS